MSLLLFDQSDRGVRGLFLYDADPEWQLRPFQLDGDLVRPLCNNGVSAGSWLIFHRQRGLWGGLFRRGDAPYNDCLPPSESVLSRGFQEGDDLEGIADAIQKRADEAFFNPFNVVLGHPVENRLLWIEQSFQHRRRTLEPGPHLLQDEREPDEPDPSDLESLTGPLPSQEELKRFARGKSDQHGSPPISDSGLCVTRSACLFEYTPSRLQLDFCFGYPPEDSWETQTVPTEAFPAE